MQTEVVRIEGREQSKAGHTPDGREGGDFQGEQVEVNRRLGRDEV